ncbi:hypothetical protein COLO4_06109 [Corchorus olitorius]|uniref:Uncharacterized protein n=1 Tax=Corchorus olitorius TaxID=93759 RepID=A0A1R3KP13_9ROSI|nr:hypothetical protein COLO4_06109 [Corchorus olitorius]
MPPIPFVLLLLSYLSPISTRNPGTISNQYRPHFLKLHLPFVFKSTVNLPYPTGRSNPTPPNLTKRFLSYSHDPNLHLLPCFNPKPKPNYHHRHRLKYLSSPSQQALKLLFSFPKLKSRALNHREHQPNRKGSSFLLLRMKTSEIFQGKVKNFPMEESPELCLCHWERDNDQLAQLLKDRNKRENADLISTLSWQCQLSFGEPMMGGQLHM